MTLPCRPGDEDRVNVVAEQVLGLLLHGARVQPAVRVEGRVGRGDEAAQLVGHARWSCGVSSGLGRISSTITMERIAVAANTLKITLSGTSRSRRMPKPQSARPPQLMLTRFMMPYPVARSCGR